MKCRLKENTFRRSSLDYQTQANIGITPHRYNRVRIEMVPSAPLCLCQLADWDPDTEREETVLVLTTCRETGGAHFW